MTGKKPKDDGKERFTSVSITRERLERVRQVFR